MNIQNKYKLVAPFLSLALCLGVNAIAKSDQPDHKSIELIGSLEIPGNLKDKSGLSKTFDNPDGLSSTSNDMLGGISAIAYTGEKDTYLMLSDRGPDDGAVDWSCRFQEICLSVNPDENHTLKFKLLKTVVLKDQFGVPMTGMASAFQGSESRPKNDSTYTRPTNPSGNQRRRLDPEGIRIAKDKNIWVSDEYGPRIIEFSPKGKLVREITPPQHFLILNPGVSKPDENPMNESGRQCNRGMEGLALSADGKTIFGLMQSPLLQDCFRAKITDTPMGLNCRLLMLSINENDPTELVYQLDEPGNKLNEILRVDDQTFITIERDGAGGVEAKFKKLMLISIVGASEISGAGKLPVDTLPKEIVPVQKTVLIDLLSPKWNLAGEKMPEKIEGLTFGPDLPDGRRTLVVASDNDFDIRQPTAIWIFALPQKLSSPY